MLRRIELEPSDRAGQRRRLLLQHLHCGGGLLDECGILLRHLVHLRDRAMHFVDPKALLVARRGDLAHHVGHVLDAANDLRHRAAGLLNQLRATGDLVDRAVDQQLDLLRRRRAALCEIAHFGCDYREALALIAGARGLDRSVPGNVRVPTISPCFSVIARPTLMPNS
jgi:hypothetical protein